MLRSHRTVRLPMIVAVWVAAWLGSSTAFPETKTVSGLPGQVEEQIRAGLDDLHSGLYERAERSFHAAMRAVPDDPTPALFLALDYWWRTVQDRSDSSLEAPFLEAVERVVTEGERRLQNAPGDTRVLTCVGTAHILRSQVEAMRKNYFKSSQEAKKGKKQLEAVLAIAPDDKNALFGLGAYNYYTERVPGIARGFLFMPKGDSERGLEQLKAAASSDSYFSVEARLLLALIYGGRDERCYEQALSHLRAVLKTHPKSPLVLGSIGGIKMRLGYYDEATRAFEDALDAASGDEPERARQRRFLNLYLAEALAADWRLQPAIEALKRAGSAATLPAREQRVFEHVRAELDQKKGLGAALAAQASGRDDVAVTMLETLAQKTPIDPRPRFLLGRLRFQQGRFADADRELATARTIATDPAPWMAGWIELYRGLALRSLGRNAEAMDHFRAASEIKKFRSAERALMEMSASAKKRGRCRS
jgi:tetratricopeptide (TPR) repeat protein